MQQQGQFRCKELRLTFYGKEKASYIIPSALKVPKSNPGQVHEESRAMHNLLKFSNTVHLFDKSISLPGQYEYPFSIVLPDWLPSSFILQSDLTKFGRRDLRLQYRLKAEMIPASRNANKQFQLFDTKRTILINRKSGVTAKHFFHEKEIDWKNTTHGNWDLNPIVSLKQSHAKVQISVDRTFYYSGDSINVLTYISNEEGELTCRGIELSLARYISCKGCQKDKRTTEKKF